MASVPLLERRRSSSSPTPVNEDISIPSTLQAPLDTTTRAAALAGGGGVSIGHVVASWDGSSLSSSKNHVMVAPSRSSRIVTPHLIDTSTAAGGGGMMDNSAVEAGRRDSTNDDVGTGKVGDFRKTSSGAVSTIVVLNATVNMREAAGSSMSATTSFSSIQRVTVVEQPWWWLWLCRWTSYIFMVQLPRGARGIAGMQCTATIKFQDVMLWMAVYTLFDECIAIALPKTMASPLHYLLVLCLACLCLDIVLNCIGRSHFVITDTITNTMDANSNDAVSAAGGGQEAADGETSTSSCGCHVYGYAASFAFCVDVLSVLSLLLEVFVGGEWGHQMTTSTTIRGMTSDAQLAWIVKYLPSLLKQTRTFRLLRLCHIIDSRALPLSPLKTNNPTGNASSHGSPRRPSHHSPQDAGGPQGAPSDGGGAHHDDIEARGRHDKAKQKAQQSTTLEKELYERVMHRILMAICVAVLFLSLSDPQQHDSAMDVATRMLYTAISNRTVGSQNASSLVLSEYLSFFHHPAKGQVDSLLLLRINGSGTTTTAVSRASRMAQLQSVNMYSVELGGGGAAASTTSPSLLAVFEVTNEVRKAVLLEQLGMPLFLVLLIVAGAYSFSKDNRRMIVQPLDSLVRMVVQLAKDPLGGVQAITNTEGNSGDNSMDFETKVIANSIKKITDLLRVGFGVAGADIIAESLDLSKQLDSTELLKASSLLPGKRVMAILGFCDIHDFDFLVKRLEAEVMTFINKVAVIVHENTSLWSGACNKNMGNSFLVIWRIGDEKQLLDASRQMWATTVVGVGGAHSPPARSAAGKPGDGLDIRRIPGVDALADQALIAFLKVHMALQRDKKIKAICQDPRLQPNAPPVKQSTMTRIQKQSHRATTASGGTLKGSSTATTTTATSTPPSTFRLHMAFGLHAGWAIEGAVGSSHKIDATYLSPHVNLAARMETAARQFKVPVLMTDSFFEILSYEAQKHCRKLDVITVKGSAVPKGIYTYDAYMDEDLPARSSFKTYSPDIWKRDKDLVALRQHASDEFRASFHVGLTNYINGLWTQAREALQACDAMLGYIGGDGPSRTLLGYMAKFDYQCPPDWKGYRPLSSK